MCTGWKLLADLGEARRARTLIRVRGSREWIRVDQYIISETIESGKMAVMGLFDVAWLCPLLLSVYESVFVAGCRVDDGVTSCHDLCSVPAGAEVVLFSGDVLVLSCLPASVKVGIDSGQETCSQTFTTVDIQ
jgi:hypothetical protein